MENIELMRTYFIIISCQIGFVTFLLGFIIFRILYIERQIDKKNYIYIIEGDKSKEVINNETHI